MTRTHQIIYSAGFFDGEGNIQIVRNKAKTTDRGFYFALRLAVFQMDKEPLLLLLALYGGRVKPCRNGHVWIASAGPAVKALESMLPYLIVKHAQASLALEFQDRRKDREGSFVTLQTCQVDEDAEDFLVMQALKKIH